MKFSITPLSSSAISLAIPRMQMKEKGTFIELFSLMYIIRMPNAWTQAVGSKLFKNPEEPNCQEVHSFPLPS